MTVTNAPGVDPRYTGMISGGLDFYKLTMSQVAYQLHPDVDVTFTFKNRGKQILRDFIDPEYLQKIFDAIQAKGFTRSEIEYYRTLKATNGSQRFSDGFLDYLSKAQFPRVHVSLKDGDIAIEATGKWPIVTFWETVVMSKVNEAYFAGVVASLDRDDVFSVSEDGVRRLDEKIAILNAHPDIKFSDFGTRRHFSLAWQRYVDTRLRDECPQNFMGTSNVGLAMELGIRPIGTFAHEMPMVYAGIADALGDDIALSHNKFLRDWYRIYGQDLSIALTDTFGTGFFFGDFTGEQARLWGSLRHDSGDPIEFGEKAIAYYLSQGVDPREKTIVFSDGLDLETILKLHKHFADRINVVFGWGTTLTNDLGIKPLNIVMKATHVRLLSGHEADLVKLSDDEGKHTGPLDKVQLYQNIFVPPPLRVAYALETREDMKRASLEFLSQQLHRLGAYPGYSSKRFSVSNADDRRLGPPSVPYGYAATTAVHDLPTPDELSSLQAQGIAIDPVQGVPVHPWIGEMMARDDIGVVTGKGAYYHWGPNYTADPIVMRNNDGVVEVLLIQRGDTGVWALPGGFIDPGESALDAAAREALEETGIDFSSFKETAVEIYSGPLADLRVTANAWPETTAFLFDVTGHELPRPKAEDDARDAQWVPLAECRDTLFGSHSMLVEMASKVFVAGRQSTVEVSSPGLPSLSRDFPQAIRPPD